MGVMLVGVLMSGQSVLVAGERGVDSAVERESKDEGWGEVRGCRQVLGIEYARRDGEPLFLDLLIPEGVDKSPVVVWLHGGGWRKGSRKSSARTAFLAERGFAVASIDYRLTGKAPFPAQILDALAACRWIEANGNRYGLDASRVGAWGSSAGAHLAALLGLTDESDWGGKVPDGAKVPVVDAVAGYCGIYDLDRVVADGSGMDPEKEGSIFWMLFGGSPAAHQKESFWAGPVNHVRKPAPPFLLVHGTADPIVPHPQAVRFDEALRAAGLESTLKLLEGGGHGRQWEAWQVSLDKELGDFFAKHLGDPQQR